MLLMSVFAALALVIAATGIYGVIAFVVSHRTRQIGVRMALGAQRSEVLGMFLRQGAVVLVAGIAAGLAGAWMLTRTIQSFLFEVGPRDPFVFTAVAVVLARSACWPLDSRPPRRPHRSAGSPTEGLGTVTPHLHRKSSAPQRECPAPSSQEVRTLSVSPCQNPPVQGES